LQDDLGTNEFMYLFENDRGGLKWPADFQLEIVTKAFVVFRVMVSKDYEAMFFNLDINQMLLVTERSKTCGAVDGASERALVAPLC